MANRTTAYADKIINIAAELRVLLADDSTLDSYKMALLGKLQKLSLEIGADDARIDDEEEGGGNGRNTRLPFGLCQREGIEIQPGWGPSDAWAALEKKGYSVGEAYKRLKETGGANGVAEGGNSPNSRGRAISEKIARALRPKRDEAIFFSGCSQVDESGNRRNSVEVAEDYAKKNKGATMGMLLANEQDFPEWDASDLEAFSSWEDASRVYAQQASGDVRVIASPPLRKGNIFENVELPALKENPDVTSVTMIDPKTGKKTELFRR